MEDYSAISNHLQTIGLDKQQAAIFLALLDKPKTPLEVSRLTGIARSNVYRIVDEMIAAGLLTEQVTEEGKQLTTADPTTLELLVVQQEHAAQERREHFTRLLPMLENIATGGELFSVKTYRGVSGLKQMLWNELKYPGEVLVFSSGSHNAATGKRWAEKYRIEIIKRGIVQRCLVNPWPGAGSLTQLAEYDKHYLPRYIAPEILPIRPEVAIHEDTVFIYSPWDHEVRLGTEIHNPFLAVFMRQMFEHYWLLAEEHPPASAKGSVKTR